MNTPPLPPVSPAAPAEGGRPQAFRHDQLEARVASRLAEGLSLRADALPHDIRERLRVSRELAVQRARQRALAAAPVAAAGSPVVTVGVRAPAPAGGGLADRGTSGPRWWQRALAGVPLLALAAGLWLIDQHNAVERVAAAADIDAQLLADDLPPAAYSDPAFAEFLRRSPP
jgi:hypothetical protein